MLLRMTLSDLLPGCVSGSDLDWQGTRLLPDRQNALTWMVRKADMPTPRLTNEIITAAIDGYEFQKTRIDAKIAELRAMLSGGPAESAVTPEPTKRKRRKMSAAGRKAISEATKKRWAAFHAAKQASKEPAPKKAARNSAKKTARTKAAVKKAVTKKVAVKKAVTKRTAPAPRLHHGRHGSRQ